MTYSRVQGAATFTASATSPVAPALSSGSTAGNLLICYAGVYNTTAAVTVSLPAGWQQAVTNFYSTGSSQAEIWYYPNCPGGITSVSVSCTGTIGQVAAYLDEWHDSAGSNASPLDLTGTAGVGGVTDVSPATAGGTLAAHDLAVATGIQYRSSSSAVTVTETAAGWTQGGTLNSGTKTNYHANSGYLADTGTAASATSDTHYSSSGNNNGVIATFQIAAAAAAGLLPQQLRGRRIAAAPARGVPAALTR